MSACFRHVLGMFHNFDHPFNIGYLAVSRCALVCVMLFHSMHKMVVLSVFIVIIIVAMIVVFLLSAQPIYVMDRGCSNGAY